MNILVTGGLGFIGSNFIRYMLTKYPSYKVHNVDKITYAGNLANLKDIENNKNYHFTKADICDADILRPIIKQSDVIINFAAETHVDRSLQDSSAFIRTNILGTHTLLESCRKFGIKKFIQISTDEVYGEVIRSSNRESDPVLPRNPYAASKASADILVTSYFSTYNLPTVILRSTNNYGPYQYPEKLIPKFITFLLANKKVPLYGDGLQIRDWLFVTDCCRAIDLLLHKGITGEIYNVASGNEKRNIEVAHVILKKLSKPKTSINKATDRLCHDRRYSLNCDKIRKLGWSPYYTFGEGISETVHWYVKNKYWWMNSRK
jgi:dTDP-glucose 4,6-dehydratase